MPKKQIKSRASRTIKLTIKKQKNISLFVAQLIFLLNKGWENNEKVFVFLASCKNNQDLGIKTLESWLDLLHILTPSI